MPDDVTERRTSRSRLAELRERYRQLLLIDSHEEAGHLLPATAAAYRLLVLRGISIIGLPLDDTPETRKWAEEQRATALEMAADTLRNPNIRAADAESRRMQRRLLRGDVAAAFVPLAPAPSLACPRAVSRAPGRRRVRSGSRRSRAPDPSEPEPPLAAEGLA
jgi:hypothetical protein